MRPGSEAWPAVVLSHTRLHTRIYPLSGLSHLSDYSETNLEPCRDAPERPEGLASGPAVGRHRRRLVSARGGRRPDLTRSSQWRAGAPRVCTLHGKCTPPRRPVT